MTELTLKEGREIVSAELLRTWETRPSVNRDGWHGPRSLVLLDRAAFEASAWQATNAKTWAHLIDVMESEPGRIARLAIGYERLRDAARATLWERRAYGCLCVARDDRGTFACGERIRTATAEEVRGQLRALESEQKAFRLVPGGLELCVVGSSRLDHLQRAKP